MCVNNLPKQNGRELNSRAVVSQANALTITPPGTGAVNEYNLPAEEQLNDSNVCA